MEKLKEIIELHTAWIRSEPNGVRANLSSANLSSADLSGVDLSSANLSGADFIRANLIGANLRHANLRYANLTGANLSGANLRGADLRYANLSGANLTGVNLSGANLRGADLSGADLRHCIGNNIEVKSMQIGTYLISYTKYILNIGCKSHTLKEWKDFTDMQISAMGSGALEWWKLNKDIVIALVERE